MGFSLEVVNAVALQPTEGVLVVTGHLFFSFLISCRREFSWFCNFDAVMIGTFGFKSGFYYWQCFFIFLSPCVQGICWFPVCWGKCKLVLGLHTSMATV